MLLEHGQWFGESMPEHRIEVRRNANTASTSSGPGIIDQLCELISGRSCVAALRSVGLLPSATSSGSPESPNSGAISTTATGQNPPQSTGSTASTTQSAGGQSTIQTPSAGTAQIVSGGGGGDSGGASGTSSVAPASGRQESVGTSIQGSDIHATQPRSTGVHGHEVAASGVRPTSLESTRITAGSIQPLGTQARSVTTSNIQSSRINPILATFSPGFSGNRIELPRSAATPQRIERTSLQRSRGQRSLRTVK
jgi:hypothetical protein